MRSIEMERVVAKRRRANTGVSPLRRQSAAPPVEMTGFGEWKRAETEIGVSGDNGKHYEFDGTCYVCAFAAGPLYWDRWDWDEWDRGDPFDDGVCGFGVGFARVGYYGEVGAAGGDCLYGTCGGECVGQ